MPLALHKCLNPMDSLASSLDVYWALNPRWENEPSVLNFTIMVFEEDSTGLGVVELQRRPNNGDCGIMPLYTWNSCIY